MRQRPALRAPLRLSAALTKRNITCACFLVFAFCFGSAQTQRPVFSTKVEVVRVDVLVTDGGRPVLGLGPADFDVLDNGVPQEVEFVSYDQIPLNVVMAFDMSDSVAGERLEHLRSACTALLPGLKRNDQAALVTFNNQIVLGAALTSELGPLREAVGRVVGAGETSLVDGAYAGLTIGESDAGRALLIVFSDGLDTLSWLSPAAVLDTAKRSDVVVYGVSVGRGKADFLRELTSFSGGRLFEMEKTANLSATFVGILEEFRQRYLVSYTPRGVSRDGWHRLEVRLKGRRATIKARPGYLAGPG
jgi:VWFA-related protein